MADTEKATAVPEAVTTSKKLRLTVPPGILLDLEVTLDEIPIVVTRVTQEFIKAGIIVPGGGGIEISSPATK